MDKLWKQITPSKFSRERECAHEQLPGHDRYLAWVNLNFIAQDRSHNEVDLSILTSECLFFDKDITEDLVTELAGREPLRVVFRDNGFISDAVKINVEQVFRQLSPSTEVKAI